MAATIGDDQPTIDTIVGNYRATFPMPPEESPDGGERDDGWMTSRFCGASEGPTMPEGFGVDPAELGAHTKAVDQVVREDLP